MKEKIFTGAAVAIITPFINDVQVDFDALGKLVEFQIEGGADAIVVCGTTGEETIVFVIELNMLSFVFLRPRPSFENKPILPVTSLIYH